MDKAIEEIEYKGLTVSVYEDTEPCCDPRENDNLGTMAIIHPRYTLGDKHAMTSRQLLRICNRKDVVALPIYMYDHSGITIRTTPFDCPWDSGQVGFIYMTKAAIRQEYGWKRVTARRSVFIKGILLDEVKTYDMFIRGEVYGYEVTDNDGDCVDSCWGFVTDDIDSILQQGKDVVDSLTVS